MWSTEFLSTQRILMPNTILTLMYSIIKVKRKGHIKQGTNQVYVQSAPPGPPVVLNTVNIKIKTQVINCSKIVCSWFLLLTAALNRAPGPDKGGFLSVFRFTFTPFAVCQSNPSNPNLIITSYFLSIWIYFMKLSSI